MHFFSPKCKVASLSNKNEYAIDIKPIPYTICVFEDDDWKFEWQVIKGYCLSHGLVCENTFFCWMKIGANMQCVSYCICVEYPSDCTDNMHLLRMSLYCVICVFYCVLTYKLCTELVRYLLRIHSYQINCQLYTLEKRNAIFFK